MEKTQSVESEYWARINKSLDFMEQNLSKSLLIDEVAKEACFSKFHFHRIFQAMLGETPYQFLNRIRLERAAIMLSSRTSMPIVEVATQVGFSDPSIFSRNFKKYFQLSPSVYRRENLLNSKNSQVNSNNQQVEKRSEAYFCSSSQSLKWKTKMEISKGVEVKELPTMTVAYVRNVGPYKGDSELFQELFGKLMAWAGPKGFLANPEMKMLTVPHDDPNVTAEEKLRISVCMTIPQETKVEGEVGKMAIEGGTYAVGRFVVLKSEFEQAWNWMYGQWLPTSGYQPDDKPCFEIYSEEKKEGKFTIDICVPVKPL